MSKDVLLEIGTEEIPAHYMPSILSQVQQLAADKLNKANIAYEDQTVKATTCATSLILSFLFTIKNLFLPTALPTFLR